MNRHTRREFLADVGRGMLLASVGSVMATDLGLAPAWAGEEVQPLVFGPLERLVAFMQETPPQQLQAALVEKLNGGTDLKTLVAAGALANARTFGGQDYVGFHTLMALPPAWQMSQRLPASHQALPVLKVLYRNADRIQSVGGRTKEVLHTVAPLPAAEGALNGEMLRAATRAADFDRAERIFARLIDGPPNEAFNHLQFAVQDEVDVHRVVLAWRAWSLLDLAGEANAHTLLRQSVRYCVDQEQERLDRKRPEPAIRTVLPKLLDEHKLLGRSPGQRHLDDAELDRLAQVVYRETRERAAETVAAALAEGIAPEDVAQALALAANSLVLRDRGRQRAEGTEKPLGSVHGASVGVHASDSANAWGNIARVSNPRNTFASLIAGAFHMAGQTSNQHDEPYPVAEHRAGIEQTDPAKLLHATDEAIRENNQARACALVDRYGELGHEPQAVFDLLLRYGTSQDGALHAEKYYHTVTEEFARSRPAFRWRQVVGLARVTASEHGTKAPGYEEACQLLGVS
jgi:hypothetical protein